MSSISINTGAVAYVAPAALSERAGTTSPEAATSEAAAPAKDPRGLTLAPETAAALIGEQTVAAKSASIGLSGQDLRGADIKALTLAGADLRGANLSGMDLSGVDLSGADLSGADLSGVNLENANLDGVKAHGARFDGAKVRNANLDNADFANANFNGAYFGRVATKSEESLDAKQINGATFAGATFIGATLDNIGFVNSAIDGADFGDATVNGVYFRDVSARGARFDGVGGFSLSFSDSDVSGALMTNMKVTHKGYSNADLTGVKFAGTSFSRTGFTLTNLAKADVSGAIREAQFASFGLTDMSGMDFSGYDFFGATFYDAGAGSGVKPVVEGLGASYRGTSFAGADFDHATFFMEADLSGADFKGAKFNQTLIDGLADSALAGKNGVRESFGDAYSSAEASALNRMRAGKEPIKRGFKMAEEVSRPMVATAPLRSGDSKAASATSSTAMENSRAIKLPAMRDLLAVENLGVAVAVDGATAALKTLSSISASMREARENEVDDDGGLTKLF